MRRLALALAVGLTLPLLGGCPTSPCVQPTLEVRWELQNLAGDQNVGCTAAGVSFVNVIVDSTLVVSNAPCSAGSAKVEALAPGPHHVTVEGRDASGVLIDRNWYDTTLAECGTTSDVARPGRGTLFIPYTTTTGSCVLTDDTTGEPAYVWFRLLDAAYGANWAVVNASSSAADKIFYHCGPYGTEPATYAPLRFNVPFGDYTLKWIQSVKHPTTTADVVYQMCTPVTVQVRRSATAGVVSPPVSAVTMAPVTSACPL